MATFNEIYNNYLSGVQGIAPISGQQGITSLATPTNSNGEMGSSPTNTATATSAPTTMNAPFSTAFSMTPMDAVMAAVNPLGGIASMAARGAGYPSLGYALGAMTGLGSMGLGGAGGASNSSGSVDTGDMGSEAANDAANASANASVGGDSGGGADSAGDGGDGYAVGGRVSYLQGGLVSLLGDYYGKR